jgi:hypothetical protein
MQHIKNFVNWVINEAKLTTHVNQRTAERIYAPSDIVIPDTILKYLDPNVVQKAKKNISDLIKEKYRERLEIASGTEYPRNISTGFPVMEMYIKYAGKVYPLSIKTDDGKYEGNQIFLSVISDSLVTVKVFPADMHIMEINRDLKLHISMKSTTKEWVEAQTLKYVDIKEEDLNILEILLHSDGSAILEEDYEREKEGIMNPDFYRKNHQFSLHKDRKIKVASPLGADGFIEGTIERVVNSRLKTFGKKPNMIILDPFVQIDLNIILNGKPAKITKKIAPGDNVYLPIGKRLGKDREFVRCEVDKKFYVSNMLLEEPIMLCVKALEFDKPE